MTTAPKPSAALEGSAGRTLALGLIVTLGICLCLVRPAWAASGRTVVVFTIDVESNGTFRLPDQVNAVCKGGTDCGLMEIVRLLQERGWSGTFFLNVYEHARWGEPAMRNIAVGLQSAGQDVALHTHPADAYDPSRWGMHQYSLDEQTAIVRDGVRLLGAWTGLPVVAHRAGSYAADAHTLEALQRNGVLVDSSVFWTIPATKLDSLGLPRNIPSRHGRLIEFPVTVYERQDRPNILGGSLEPITVVRKIDPDWFINEQEMRASIDAAIAAEIPVLVVFLHSFSFMDIPVGPAPRADTKSMAMFKALLDHLARKNPQVMTMRELARSGLTPAVSSAHDTVPTVQVAVSLPLYVWRRMKASRPFTVWVGIVGIGSAMAAAFAALVVVRRYRGGQRVSGPADRALHLPEGGRVQ